jgi:hypothetical protein
VIGCLWGVGTYAKDVFDAYSALAWPQGEGVTVYSQAVRGCGKGDSFYPRVRFTYSVNGVSYVGTRVAFGNVGCGSYEHARSIAAKFPPGVATPVYYDPGNPGQAVLMAGEVLSDTWLGLGMMSLMAALGTWFTAKAARDLRRTREDR